MTAGFLFSRLTLPFRRRKARRHLEAAYLRGAKLRDELRREGNARLVAQMDERLARLRAEIDALG